MTMNCASATPPRRPDIRFPFGRPRALVVTLPAHARAAGVARQVTRDVLQDWQLGGLEETALLVVSELIGNAVSHARHGGAPLRLWLCAAGAALRIEVHDPDPREPCARVAVALAESGRGLHILDAVTSEWGACPAGRGKAVWAELALDGLARPPAPPTVIAGWP